MYNACLARSVFKLVELIEEKKKDLQSFKIMKIIQREKESVDEKKLEKESLFMVEMAVLIFAFIFFSLKAQQLKLLNELLSLMSVNFIFQGKKLQNKILQTVNL